MKNLKLLEEEVQELEDVVKNTPKLDQEQLGAVAVGGARRKRKEMKKMKSHPNPSPSNFLSKSPFLTF